MASGLLEAKHRDRIGPAIWEFGVLIDWVTEEYVENGERWGKVWGGRPIKAEQIAERLGTHPETVRNNLRRLKEWKYIRTRRTSHGDSIEVRKSTKWINRQDTPSTGRVILEFVEIYRNIPGVTPHERDHSIMGSLLKKHGADKLIYGLTRLRQAMEIGLPEKGPESYLVGILGGRKKAAEIIPEPSDGLKSSADAWVEVITNIGSSKPKPWSNVLIGEAVKLLGGSSVIGQSPPGTMMMPFITTYNELRTGKAG